MVLLLQAHLEEALRPVSNVFAGSFHTVSAAVSPLTHDLFAGVILPRQAEELYAFHMASAARLLSRVLRRRTFHAVPL